MSEDHSKTMIFGGFVFLLIAAVLFYAEVGIGFGILFLIGGLVQLYESFSTRVILITSEGIYEKYRYLRFLEELQVLRFSDVDGYCKVICAYTRGFGRTEERIHKNEYWFLNKDNSPSYILPHDKFKNIGDMLKAIPTPYLGEVELSESDYKNNKIPKELLSLASTASDRNVKERIVCPDSDKPIYIATDNKGQVSLYCGFGVFLGIMALMTLVFCIYQIVIQGISESLWVAGPILIWAFFLGDFYLGAKEKIVLTIDEQNARFLIKTAVVFSSEKSLPFDDVMEVHIDREEHLTIIKGKKYSFEMDHAKVSNIAEIHRAIRYLQDKGRIC